LEKIYILVQMAFWHHQQKSTLFSIILEFRNLVTVSSIVKARCALKRSFHRDSKLIPPPS